jgi:hypothetical protein
VSDDNQSGVTPANMGYVLANTTAHAIPANPRMGAHAVHG